MTMPTYRVLVDDIKTIEQVFGSMSATALSAQTDQTCIAKGLAMPVAASSARR